MVSHELDRDDEGYTLGLVDELIEQLSWLLGSRAFASVI